MTLRINSFVSGVLSTRQQLNGKVFPVHPPFIPRGAFVGAGSLWPSGRLLSPFLSFILQRIETF